MAIALDKVREIAQRVAASSGLELWDLELKGSGAGRILRVFIDKPDGVSHEDCAVFSREVATIFDVEDAVPGGAYVLEISSPGLDRRLWKAEHFERFAGSRIRLSTHEPVNGGRKFEGRLTGFSGGELTLEVSQAGGKKAAGRKIASPEVSGSVVVALTNVEKANLVPEF
jgi:ribosome maturation factor RimP